MKPLLKSLALPKRYNIMPCLYELTLKHVNASGKSPANTEARLFKEEMSDLTEQSVSKDQHAAARLYWGNSATRKTGGFRDG